MEERSGLCLAQTGDRSHHCSNSHIGTLVVLKTSTTNVSNTCTAATARNRNLAAVDPVEHLSGASCHGGLLRVVGPGCHQASDRPTPVPFRGSPTRDMEQMPGSSSTS
ncbi:unnamed protein product [Candidula unifasciata]|uniref:Uncharacterized protein n=1 Tax=Candidula unifasciata TaxID=100452 RepID=A0A8S4A269_9EUPU|nr:unnamed protein product [Candidula unifasciata]